MSNIFSGTDIRGHMDDSFTPEYVWNVGKAFADWLPVDGPVLVVATPLASERIVKAVIEGLRLQGRTVLDGGQGDEQTLIQIAAAERTAGSILIGHQDLQKLESLQFYQETNQLVTSDNGLVEITDMAEAANFVPAAAKGELTSAL